jgi:hypothetical protein
MRGSKAEAGSFMGERGRPRYGWVKEDMGHPSVEAMASASTVETIMGMKQDLWKFIASPVATAKVIQNPFEGNGGRERRFAQDKGVIPVLHDGTRGTSRKGVRKIPRCPKPDG